MSVIGAANIGGDEELTLDRRTWDKLKSIDPEEIEKHLPKREESEEEEDDLERKFKFFTDGAETEKKATSKKGEAEESDSEESISEDEALTRVDRMANEMDEREKQQKQYKMLKDKRELKRELKTKALVDLQRTRRMDESDDEKLLNEDINVKGDDASGNDSVSENDDDLV